MFFAQVSATILSAVVQVGVGQWLFSNVKDSESERVLLSLGVRSLNNKLIYFQVCTTECKISSF